MKRLLTLLALVSISFSAIADEGMWLLPYIKKMNEKDMKAHGCKLKAEDIYSAEKSSLKEALVSGARLPQGWLLGNELRGGASCRGLIG